MTDTLSASLSLESSSLTGAISQATLITDRVSGHRNRSSGERECHLQICTNTMILGSTLFDTLYFWALEIGYAISGDPL